MKKYRPSNGTEGMGFCEMFCEQCIHEKFIHTQNDADKKCDILSRTLMHDVEDPEYPEEWTYDSEGNPTCTAFQKWDWGNDGDGWNDLPEPEPEDPNQMCFPFVMDEINEQNEVVV